MQPGAVFFLHSLPWGFQGAAKSEGVCVSTTQSEPQFLGTSKALLGARVNAEAPGSEQTIPHSHQI